LKRLAYIAIVTAVFGFLALMWAIWTFAEWPSKWAIISLLAGSSNLLFVGLYLTRQWSKVTLASLIVCVLLNGICGMHVHLKNDMSGLMNCIED
jgi:hypothetical protein